MRGGRLRDRVTVQQLVETPDVLGQPIQSWLNVGTFWGNVIELSGKELEIARQIRADLTHQVTMRNVSVGKLSPVQHRLLGVSGTLAGRVINLFQVLDVDGKDRNYKILGTAIVS